MSNAERFILKPGEFEFVDEETLAEHHPHLTGTPQSVHAGKGRGVGLPVEPGTTPVPAGMIRGYHYTFAIDAVLEQGLDVKYAKGSTYGEPDAIWFSAEKPDPSIKSFVEVHIRPEEVTIGHPGMYNGPMTQAQIDWMHGIGANFTVSTKHISPDRFVTHSKPWHDTARRLLQDYAPGTERGDAAIASGEFDFLKDWDNGAFAPALSMWKSAFKESAPVIEFTDRPLSPLYESYLVRSIERMRLTEANPSSDDAIRALRFERSLRRRIRAIRDVLSLEQDLRAVEDRVMQQTAEMLEQQRLYILDRLQQARASWDIHQAQMILIEIERQQAIMDDAISSALRDALDEALFGGQQQAVRPLFRAGIEISIEPMISRQFVIVSQATLPQLIKGVTDQMINRIGTLLRQSVLGQHSIFELMQEIGKVPGMTTVSDYLKPFRWSKEDVRRATRGQGPYAKAFYRAEMITRTEIGRIAQTANYLTLAELSRDDPRYMKEWGAVDDARTRPWHAAADGQRVQVNEAFTIGGEAMMYPHDPRASGRNTINCRCVSVPWHPRFDDPDFEEG